MIPVADGDPEPSHARNKIYLLEACLQNMAMNGGWVTS